MKKALIVAACLLFTTLSAQTISSNFNTNDDGWQVRDFPLGGTNTVTYRTTGGNPTGHISFKDRNILPATTIYFVAPQKFLGNKSWAYNNTLTFDLKIETGTFFYEDDVILEGNGITLALDLPNPTNAWSSFTCTLNELSGWKVSTRNGPVATQMQMQAVLCNLTKIWIRAEFYTNFLQFDEGFLDNVALNLTPCTPNVLSETRTICTGQNVVLNGKTYNQTGVYADTIKRCYPQCDSIINLNLTVIDAFRTTLNPIICTGNSFLINNKSYTQTGVYKDTLKTINNCDSILMTNLIVAPPLSKIQEISLCEGDFIRINNKIYNQTGVYKDTLKTLNNCDSILTTHLIVNRRFSRTQGVVICPNSVYLINNKRYSVAGIYKDTLKTINNCDSIIITNLSFIPPLSISTDFSLCKGDFIKIGNKIYSQIGIYRDTFKTVNGCDSILITNLTIKPERKKTIDTTICEGKQLIINGKQYLKAGIYGDTILSNAQCDSILLITIKTTPYPIIKKTVILCANDSTVVNGRLFTKIGVFKDTINAAINCDSVIEWTVQKSNLQLYMGENTTIELGDSLQLGPSVFGAPNVLWTWQTNKALSCTNCPNPFVKPLFTTTFTLVIRDTLSGCTLRNALKITVKPCENIFMPTAFSPNNDGANDYFTIFASGCVRKVNKMQLFNRWGVMVFSKNNFLANNEKNGWDGTMNSTQLPPDVYIYVIELELGNGKIKVFSGDVTLIR